MHGRTLVILPLVICLLPVGTAVAAPTEDVLDATEVSAESPAGGEIEGPAEAPVAAPAAPVGPAPATVVEPEYTGKGLIGAAIGLTAFSWISRFTSLGVAASTDSCANDSCAGKVTAAVALLYMAPISQFIATGLVIPGGVIKGRHDGWRSITTGQPQRNGKTFVVAGGVVFGVFTALSIALRPVYITSVVNCVGDNLEGSGSSCGGIGGVVGYNVGVAVSDAASTAGAGLMSYGLGYKGFTRRHGGKISVAPFNSRGAYGLSLSGRF